MRRRQTERTSRIESKNNDEEKDERTRDDESKTSKEKEVEKSFDKALSKKLTTMAIPSKERKQNILLRTLTAVAITCAAILPQISERPPTPAMSIGTARTSTLVVGATKSVLDDAGLKKEKDRKRSSWYAGTINL
jgi:3-oxoacyl-(acyl-carrier-protein) synthase|tara:strand:- start:472 stop:876 length:405 start_codon:yes stop_codon:yes gene_type:complete